jgi:hypothetical protein
MEIGKHFPIEMHEFRRVTERFDGLRGESLARRAPELSSLMDPAAHNPLAITIATASRFGKRLKSRLS